MRHTWPWGCCSQYAIKAARNGLRRSNIAALNLFFIHFWHWFASFFIFKDPLCRPNNIWNSLLRSAIFEISKGRAKITLCPWEWTNCTDESITVEAVRQESAVPRGNVCLQGNHESDSLLDQCSQRGSPHSLGQHQGAFGTHWSQSRGRHTRLEAVGKPVVYYFVHFLILLPLLGKFEKNRPLPESIGKPVLAE